MRHLAFLISPDALPSPNRRRLGRRIRPPQPPTAAAPPDKRTPPHLPPAVAISTSLPMRPSPLTRRCLELLLGRSGEKRRYKGSKAMAAATPAFSSPGDLRVLASVTGSSLNGLNFWNLCHPRPGPNHWHRRRSPSSTSHPHSCGIHLLSSQTEKIMCGVEMVMRPQATTHGYNLHGE